MIRNKKLGTLIGLAIGDAMGAPYEFKRQIEYKPTKKYNTGGVHGVSIGEWTDDTSMALCLLDSLLECNGKFNPLNQISKYYEWYINGLNSTRGVCFDIGNSTYKSIYSYSINPKLYINSPYSKSTGPYESGNGTIMRLAPIPMLFDKGSYKEFAKLSSKVTHKSNEASLCCELLSTIIINCYYMNNKNDILNIDNNLIRKGKNLNLNTISTGYCNDTLEVAIRGFLKYDNFIDGLLYVISLGEDTDTVGAVYGQIAGSYYGLDKIPEYYKNNLMWYNDILDRANKLINLTN